MDLSPRETADLASFFSRRFPRRAQVDALARSARIVLDDTLVGEDGVLWTTVLAEARVQKRLRALARQASRQEPGDPNLQEVCRLLAASEPAPVLPWVLGGGAILALLAFGVGAWIGTRGPAASAPEPSPPTALAAPAVESPAVAAAPTEEPPAEPPPGEPPPGEAVPEEAPAAVAAVAPAAVAPAAVAPAATSAASRCPGQPGELIGYWYVGRSSPGAKGQTITVATAANVRADYPDRHNGYDARAPLRCGLRAGDRIRLSQDPVAVPGGVYWVPLYGGDLLD